MEVWEALIFGIVQGITEFLPISSTAHIVIVEHILNKSFPDLVFEIFLHLASALAVILYYRRDLVSILQKFFRYIILRRLEDKAHFFFGLYILLATFMTGTLGLGLKDLIDENLKSPITMGLGLILTGTFLILIERTRVYGTRTLNQMRLKDAIWVGLAQSLAILPGISRSGSTLIAGLWTGLDRDTAVRFSFLTAIPVILGSSILLLRDMPPISPDQTQAMFLPYSLAFLASFITSIVSIRWLIHFLKTQRLVYFAGYCFLAGLFCLFIL